MSKILNVQLNVLKNEIQNTLGDDLSSLEIKIDKDGYLYGSIAIVGITKLYDIVNKYFSTNVFDFFSKFCKKNNIKNEEYSFIIEITNESLEYFIKKVYFGFENSTKKLKEKMDSHFSISNNSIYAIDNTPIFYDILKDIFGFVPNTISSYSIREFTIEDIINKYYKASFDVLGTTYIEDDKLLLFSV